MKALAFSNNDIAVLADPRLAVPARIYASAPTRHHTSRRPQQTVMPLARALGGGSVLDLQFGEGDEAALAEAAKGAGGAVLIAWHHHHIPAIANAILGNAATCPQDWDPARFDMSWVFDRRGAGWQFSQVPQMLLAGDSDQPLGP